MLALIKCENKEYYTPVLVEHNNGWNSKVLIFDSDYKKLILQDYWIKKGRTRKRSVYILDSTNLNWVSKGKYRGKKELIENKVFLKEIKKGKLSNELYDISKIELSNMVIKEWYPIKNEQDVETFNNLAYGLHDAYVIDIKKQSGFTLVHFDTTWSCQILMKFYDVEKSNLIDYGPVYSTSYFEFEDKKVIFLADLCWNEDGIESPRVICSKIEYKLYKTENAFNNSKSKKVQIKE